MQTQNKRLLWLDIVKILAAFLVIVLHTMGTNLNNNHPHIDLLIYYLGTFAIPLFFMVNGYLQLGKKQEITYSYVFHKIAKILLIVLVWNIPILIAKKILKKEKLNIISMIIQNFFQQGYFWQFWFLGALILIYMFLPLYQKLFNKCNTKILIFILILLCFLVDILNIHRNFIGLPIIKDCIPQTLRLWTWITYFFLGGGVI